MVEIKRKIELHLTAKQLRQIDEASINLRTSTSAFIAKAALECAQQVHLDQILFEVTEDQFVAFEKKLSDPPPRDNNAFERLMTLNPIWDTKQK